MILLQDLNAGITQVDQMNTMFQRFINWGIDAGKNIVIALIVFLVGHYLIKFINKMIAKMMDKRNLEPSIKTFLKSFVNIVLKTLLIVSVVSSLGVDTTSFAALLASAGLAVGMALSGNLQNFAGGIIILFFKPFKVGDYIEAQGNEGTVKEIQIFHTIITTGDNKEVYIPNGALSSGNVVNYSHNSLRRIQWTIGIDYGDDIAKARKLLLDLFSNNPLICKDKDHEPAIKLGELSASSVDIYVRVWVKTEDYWTVYFDCLEEIYKVFNENGVNFPFPQLTVHQA